MTGQTWIRSIPSQFPPLGERMGCCYATRLHDVKRRPSRFVESRLVRLFGQSGLRSLAFVDYPTVNV